jgi:hypothetical protein
MRLAVRVSAAWAILTAEFARASHVAESSTAAFRSEISAAILWSAAAVASAVEIAVFAAKARTACNSASNAACARLAISSDSRIDIESDTCFHVGTLEVD